jgi:sterol desaturase/sphingolipid hydroxylase (fatty acid hydroxylase superfamily)
LPYIADSEVFASFSAFARTCFWIWGVPQFRDLHFYFAHKFIHFRALYKYIHSLHHRNTDIEPFSGLCMHPIEHLYYITSVVPSLFFLMSPLHLMWNIQHLLLSPAASHSGWEDNWQR